MVNDYENKTYCKMSSLHKLEALAYDCLLDDAYSEKI